MTTLFLHAFPLGPRMWEPQGPQHAPRLYGRGASIEQWAASLLAEYEGEVALVGASMGGYCALEIVRRAPERVTALVLAGSRPDADSPERKAGRADTIRLIREQGVGALWESMRPKLFAEDANPEAVALARMIVLEQDPEELAAAVAAIGDRRDNTDTWRSFRGPKLAVIGEHDPFVSPGEVEGAVAVPGAGHLVSLERPHQFDELLEQVLP